MGSELAMGEDKRRTGGEMQYVTACPITEFDLHDLVDRGYTNLIVAFCQVGPSDLQAYLLD